MDRGGGREDGRDLQKGKLNLPDVLKEISEDDRSNKVGIAFRGRASFAEAFS